MEQFYATTHVEHVVHMYVGFTYCEIKLHTKDNFLYMDLFTYFYIK